MVFCLELSACNQLTYAFCKINIHLTKTVNSFKIWTYDSYLPFLSGSMSHMFNSKNQFTNLTAYVCIQAQKAYCVLYGLKFCKNPI